MTWADVAVPQLHSPICYTRPGPIYHSRATVAQTLTFGSEMAGRARTKQQSFYLCGHNRMLMKRCSEPVQTLKNPRCIVPACHDGFKSLEIFTGPAWSQTRGICVSGVVKIVDANRSHGPRMPLAKPSRNPRKTLAKAPKSPSNIPIQIALIAVTKIAGRHQGIARNPCICLLAGDSAGRLDSGEGNFCVDFATEKQFLRHTNLSQRLLLLATVNPHRT